MYGWLVVFYFVSFFWGREFDVRSTAPRPPIYVAHQRGMAEAFVAFRFVRLARQFVVADFVDSFDTLFERCACGGGGASGKAAAVDQNNNNKKKKKGPPSKKAAAKPRDTKRALLDALDARAKALRAQITGNFSLMDAENILVGRLTILFVVCRCPFSLLHFFCFIFYKFRQFFLRVSVPKFRQQLFLAIFVTSICETLAPLF